MKRKRRDKTIKLDKPRQPYAFGSSGREYRQWDRSLPFFRASAGVLLHRVASALDFLRGGKVTHTAVHYVCGNSGFIGRGSEFVSDPRKTGWMVCAACEFKAQKKRLPSADKIVGHHVHVGRLVAVQLCCCDQGGSDQ